MNTICTVIRCRFEDSGPQIRDRSHQSWRLNSIYNYNALIMAWKQAKTFAIDAVRIYYINVLNIRRFICALITALYQISHLPIISILIIVIYLNIFYLNIPIHQIFLFFDVCCLPTITYAMIVLLLIHDMSYLE